MLPCHHSLGDFSCPKSGRELESEYQYMVGFMYKHIFQFKDIKATPPCQSKNSMAIDPLPPAG